MFKLLPSSYYFLLYAFSCLYLIMITDNFYKQVDGDTDSSAVLEDFCSVLSGLMHKAEAGENTGGQPNGRLPTGTDFLPPTGGAYHQVN